MKDYTKMTVGEIVADNMANADLFGRLGIDYCCHGSDSLPEAAAKAGVAVDEVVKQLGEVKATPSADSIDFRQWPIDLLCDYILKIYHRYIRREGPEIQKLMEKVVKVHGVKHPSLFEVQELFNVSLNDLYHHLAKEENVLFPYIYTMADADYADEPAPDFHCGSVANPIEVMKMEHSIEGERYFYMEELTGGYTAPEDGCASYKKLMAKLKEFNTMLHHHIHLENNILFPEAIALETRLQSRSLVMSM